MSDDDIWWLLRQCAIITIITICVVWAVGIILTAIFH